MSHPGTPNLLKQDRVSIWASGFCFRTDWSRNAVAVTINRWISEQNKNKEIKLTAIFEGFYSVAFVFLVVEVQFQATLNEILFPDVCPMNSKWKTIQALFASMPRTSEKKDDSVTLINFKEGIIGSFKTNSSIYSPKGQTYK